MTRRTFLAGMVAAFFPIDAFAARKPRLVVWACGGLADALRELNAEFARKYDCRVRFTGGAAGYLTRALVHQYRGQIDVFVARTATTNPRYLHKYGKMHWMKLFCASEYVIITPKGNPARIRTVKDLGRKGVRVAFPPKAAKPSSECVLQIAEAGGVREQFLRNVVVDGDCPRKFLQRIVSGSVDAAIVERRLALIKGVRGRVEVIPIPPEIAYHGARCKEKAPFVLILMKGMRERKLAEAFVDFALSERGRRIMEAHGFIHAHSPKMRKISKMLSIDRKLLAK